MKNIKIVSIVIVAVILIVAGVVYNKYQRKNLAALRPSESISPTPTSDEPLGTPSGKDLQSLTPEEVEKLLGEGGQPSVPYGQLTKAATCKLEGTIKFLNPTLYRHEGNVITYTGIDSPARQIKWTINPPDNIKVGPNLTAQLKLPDGESPVDATLPQNPISKKYSLTASITYGRLQNGDVKIYEAKCSGITFIELAY
jgi:hypothetical protein